MTSAPLTATAAVSSVMVTSVAAPAPVAGQKTGDGVGSGVAVSVADAMRVTVGEAIGVSVGEATGVSVGVGVMVGVGVGGGTGEQDAEVAKAGIQALLDALRGKR